MIEIKGIEETIAALKELDRKVQNQAIRKGLRAGGKVWKAAAKAEAPSRTGKLSRSIKVRAGKRSKGSISITVGMSSKDYTGEAFYGSFIEYGYRIGKRSLGDARKLQPANPFMQRAFDQSKDEAADVAIETIRQEVEGIGK